METIHDCLMAATALRNGGQIVPGHNGCNALRVRNANPSMADDYVSLNYGISAIEDFSLQVWIKVPEGGYGGWCSTQEMLPKEEYLAFDAYTAEQQGRCSVLLANIPLFEGVRPGFMVTLSQPRNYATVYFRAENQTEPTILWGLRDIQDGRWHQLTVTVARKDKLCAYIDGELKKQADVSKWSGGSVDAGPLTVGADSLGTHGVFDGIISGLSLIAETMGAEDIRRSYYCGALAILSREIVARQLDLCGFYSPEAARSLITQAVQAQNKTAAEDAEQTYLALRKEYEAFLLNINKADFQFMLISDVHCDGTKGKRADALKSSLQWARKLKMQAVLDCGDYSAYGKTDELDSYWNVMAEEWPDRPLFVSLGNHETLELKSHDLVEYHCNQLMKRDMVPKGYHKLYYEGEINGHHVIVLSQYSDTYSVSGYNGLWAQAGEIKPEQIKFLKDRLDRYCNQDKPVFLIIHNAVKPLLDQLTRGRSPDNMIILKGDALYDVLEGRTDVVLCTGHVHNGFGGGAGIYNMQTGYHVIDTVGFRCSTFGYGIGVNDMPGIHHCGYFIFVFKKTLLLRAADLASGEWLTAYDQVIQIKG